MPYQKILMATDGSENSLKAADHAARLAEELGAQVEVLSVAVVYPMYGGLHVGAVGLEAEVESAAQLAAADTAKIFEEKGVSVQTVVTSTLGNAGSVICAEADEFGADLIVVGSRGLGRTTSILMGSVSYEVVHHSSRPVLVVR